MQSSELTKPITTESLLKEFESRFNQSMDLTKFTKEELEHNKKIASLRIHVERYMERLKNWHFFDRPIPISMSDIASDTWIVVACFSNFLPPIVC